MNELALQQPIDSGLRELALFAGAGGGILGGKLLGWRTVCAVEWDAYAASVLIARQNDGILPPFPIWDDVQTFDGKPWRGRVDVVSGGFPCQDISCAGKGAGIEGERSSMWKHMARIIGEVRPKYAFVENSPMLVGRGLAVVLADLAEMGYDARWGIVGAHHAAAPHKRDRIWLVAHSDSSRMEKHRPLNADSFVGSSAAISSEEPQESGSDVADANALRELQPQGAEQNIGRWLGNGGTSVANANGSGLKKQWRALADGAEHETAECGGWWSAEPDVGRVAHGVAARVDRLRCIGNGQVPAVVRLAWETLTQDFYQP